MKIHLLLLSFAVLIVGGSVVIATAIWIISSTVMSPAWHQPSNPSGKLRPIPVASYYDEVWQGIHHNPLQDLSLDYQEVKIPVNGQQISAWYVVASNHTSAILAVHGVGTDRRNFLRHTEFLYHAGYNVLLIDLRNHGTSDRQGKGFSYGSREQKDIIAATNWLKNAGNRCVVVMGTSGGAAAAINAASKHSEINAVIAENTYSSLQALLHYQASLIPLMPSALVSPVTKLIHWRGNTPLDSEPIDNIQKLNDTPVLFIHARGDTMIPYTQSRQVFNASHSKLHTLWEVEGSEHIRIFNDYPDIYKEKVLAFLQPIASAECVP